MYIPGETKAHRSCSQKGLEFPPSHGPNGGSKMGYMSIYSILYTSTFDVQLPCELFPFNLCSHKVRQFRGVTRVTKATLNLL